MRLIQSYRRLALGFHLCDHVPWGCQRQNFLDDQRWSNGLTDNCNLVSREWTLGMYIHPIVFCWEIAKSWRMAVGKLGLTR